MGQRPGCPSSFAPSISASTREEEEEEEEEEEGGWEGGKEAGRIAGGVAHVSEALEVRGVGLEGGGGGGRGKSARGGGGTDGRYVGMGEEGRGAEKERGTQ